MDSPMNGTTSQPQFESEISAVQWRKGRVLLCLHWSVVWEYTVACTAHLCLADVSHSEHELQDAVAASNAS